MSTRWSRRTFLAAAAATPLITIEARTSRPAFEESERLDLEAAMDEIIPAGDGMPAASEIGGVEYLERVAETDAKVTGEIKAALAALGRQSARPFHELDHEARVRALKKLEGQDPEQFGHLRDYVYESYYTQPRVWKLIGYEFYPTDHAGPRMEPFDESILEDVRKMPKLYREA